VAKSLEGKTILIVDDDPDIVALITAGLDDTGVTIESASDGITAGRMVEERDPDLVILDIMLPQKSGFLVLEKLRKGRPRGSRPYVVMITGNEGRRHRQYAEALGVDGYLNKPFRMERLLEITEKLLSD
jgi:DNA-binding response OmpR family regulator